MMSNYRYTRDWENQQKRLFTDITRVSYYLRSIEFGIMHIETSKCSLLERRTTAQYIKE